MLPDKADAHGFKFRHETLGSALAAILGGEAVSDATGERSPALWRPIAS